MKVVVTGAAGKLGRETCRELTAAGHEVHGVDFVGPQGAGSGVNLLDFDTTAAALIGATAVVHLANHPTHRHRPAQKVYSENCATNVNVFEAARAGGLHRVIYASSIHACTGGRTPAWPVFSSELPYLPLDGEMPWHCDEVYGLSKICGEQLLQLYAREYALEAAALRFPRLNSTPPPRDGWKLEGHPWLDEAFTWLTYVDAARCLAAALVAPIHGYRCYCPAHPRPWIDESPEELRQKYYPTVRLKSPAPLTSLVDLSTLTRDLGWSPSDANP